MRQSFKVGLFLQNTVFPWTLCPSPLANSISAEHSRKRFIATIVQNVVVIIKLYLTIQPFLPPMSAVTDANL